MKAYISNANLELHFHQWGEVELTKTLFFHPLIQDQLLCVRGKHAGAYDKQAGSFQWTSAVRALCLLLLRSKVDQSGPDISTTFTALARSLDYAIDKSPQWLMDMFGVDRDGLGLIRRLTLRTNTNGKRPGPVELSLNRAFLNPVNIKVYLNDKLCTSPQEILLLVEAIQPGYKSRLYSPMVAAA